jgi:UDP-GlcNAc:undecaprenyl-phosphate/decaprenyl-phosphate GlcNAc-1-phosphate transferase
VHEYEFFLTLLVAASVTYLLTPMVRLLAIKVHAVPPARDRDVHAEPIPRMGGIAIYFGVAAGLLVADELGMLSNVITGASPVTGLLPAGALIMGIGIIDDRWGMNSVGKLAGQVAAAGVLFASGAQLSTFPEPNDHLFAVSYNESLVLTIVVVVATINAVNFIDGLDGLAAGIVCIAAVSFFVYYYSLAQKVGLPAETGPALVAVVLAGACLGFLPHNFNPARIFMGDTGSMLLGLLLSYIPISAISSLDFTNLQNKANRYGELLPLLLPAAVLVIPYVDMLRAVVRRTRAGQSPFAADRKHLHHQMLEIGHSHRSSVLILYAWAALFAGAIVGLSIVTVKLLVLAGTTLALVLVLGLLSIPKLRWWQRDRAPDAAEPVAPVASVADRAASVAAPLAADSLGTPGRTDPRASRGRADPPLATPALMDSLLAVPPVEARNGRPPAATVDESASGSDALGRGSGSNGTDPRAPSSTQPTEAPADATVPLPIARASGRIIP